MLIMIQVLFFGGLILWSMNNTKIFKAQQNYKKHYEDLKKNPYDKEIINKMWEQGRYAFPRDAELRVKNDIEMVQNQ